MRRARPRRRRRRGRGRSDEVEEGLLLWRTVMMRRTPRSTSVDTFGDASTEAAAAGHIEQQRRRAPA
jgi:hypothetical protein